MQLAELKSAARWGKEQLRTNGAIHLGADAANRPFYTNSKLKVAVMTAMLVGACFTLYYHHAITGTGTGIVHFLYITVILAALWWRKRGIWIAVFLAAAFILSSSIFGEDALPASDYASAFMFIAVSLVTAILSERIIKSEKKVRENEKKLQDIVANSADCVWEIDAVGRYTYASDKYEDMLGYKPEELIGKYIYDISLPEDRERMKEMILKSLATGKRFRGYERHVQDKNGKSVWIATNAVPMRDGKGNFAGYRGTDTDITLKRQVMIDVREKNAQLEEASQAKSRFLAGMSHELRTPLNAIIGFSELMLDGMTGNLNDDQRDCLNDILHGGRHLLGMINNVLDLSKVEAGKMKLELESVDIAEVAGEAVQTVRSLITEKGHRLEVNVAPNLPHVWADGSRTLQVLINLLGNAIKFTPPDGKITVSASSLGSKCLISVSDNGPGIRADDQEKVFDAFAQAEAPGEEVKEGTGLGLKLCRQFVELMGGQIWVESEYGKGSTFSFTLPVAVLTIPYQPGREIIHTSPSKKPVISTS